MVNINVNMKSAPPAHEIVRPNFKTHTRVTIELQFTELLNDLKVNT